MAELVDVASIAQAVATRREVGEEARYLAGGTALVLLMKMKMLQPRVLISLRGIADPQWTRVRADDRAIVLGGGVSIAQLADDPLVTSSLPSLSQAAAVVGNIRIRNAATLGGLMAEADYASDPPATLVSLNASVILSRGDSERTIPVAEFITDFFTTELGEDEVITGVSVPRQPPGTRSTYLKFTSRSAEDRPCVGVAATGRFEGEDVQDLRVVVGAVSGRPQWFPEITHGHVGRPLTDGDIGAIAAAYAESIDPISDVRGTEWYRREVTRAQVTRALRRVRNGPMSAPQIQGLG